MIPKSILAEIEVNPNKYQTIENFDDKLFFGPPYAVLNISKLGYRYFRLLLKIKEDKISKFLLKFKEHPNVGWIFKTSGSANIALGCWVLDNNEIYEITNNIKRELRGIGKIVYQSELNQLIGFSSRPVHKVFNPMTILDSKLERIDVKPEELELLKQISLDASLSISDYSSILNMNSVKVKKMINNLEQTGIILGYQSRVNYRNKYYKIFVDTLNLTENEINQLNEKLWNDERCIYIEKANGKYDFEFEIIVESEKELKEYTKNFDEFWILEFKENLYSNLLPISKSLDVNELFSIFKKDKSRKIINLCNSKIWYLTNEGSTSWLKTYSDKNYAELMKNGEISLYKEAYDVVSNSLNKSKYFLIDLGSGDGLKGKEFIKKIPSSMFSGYYPVDINIIQLQTAIKVHKKAGYKIQPYLMEFKNISSKFPLRLNPTEGQIVALFGGTYGNFKLEEINKYISSILSNDSLSLISINIRDYTSKSEIIESYLNKSIQDYVMQPLLYFGFEESDFISNRNNSELKLQIEFINNGIKSFFKLNENKEIRGLKFNKGTEFYTTFSWKPTIEEFRQELSKKFKIVKILNNKTFALAIVNKK